MNWHNSAFWNFYPSLCGDCSTRMSQEKVFFYYFYKTGTHINMWELIDLHDTQKLLDTQQVKHIRNYGGSSYDAQRTCRRDFFSSEQHEWKKLFNSSSSSTRTLVCPLFVCTLLQLLEGLFPLMQIYLTRQQSLCLYLGWTTYFIRATNRNEQKAAYFTVCPAL